MSDYVKNDVFNILNSSLPGKIILGQYKKDGSINRTNLKKVLIYKLLENDEVNYRIKQQSFIKTREDIVELFPTEDPDFYYLPPIEDRETGATIGSRGCLYNFYKIARAELRHSGLLLVSSESKNDSTLSEIDESGIESLNCLTDPERSNHTASQVVSTWETSYDDRQKLLFRKDKKNKKIPVAKYLKSFPCIVSPYGILLLEQDFDKYIQHLSSKSIIPKESASTYSSMFCLNWPNIAKKIVAHSRKLKIPEVVALLKQHENLLITESNINFLSLLLLPFIIRAVKTIKIGERTVAISKQDMAKCFILHIQVPENFEKEQKLFELWLTSMDQPTLPYVICCGNLSSVQSFVVLNNENYAFADPVSAIQACYKCLIALNSCPTFCDFVWNFVDKSIYDFKFKKVSSWVTKLCLDLNNQSL